MAEIRYKVCDRCGDKIDPKNGWISVISGEKHTSKINLWKCLAGYVSYYSYELCSECTDKLNDFLKNKEGVI